MTMQKMNQTPRVILSIIFIFIFFCFALKINGYCALSYEKETYIIRTEVVRVEK